MGGLHRASGHGQTPGHRAPQNRVVHKGSVGKGVGAASAIVDAGQLLQLLLQPRLVRCPSLLRGYDKQKRWLKRLRKGGLPPFLTPITDRFSVCHTLCGARGTSPALAAIVAARVAQHQLLHSLLRPPSLRTPYATPETG